MSNWWELSTDEDISSTGNSFESGGGVMEPIPNNTDAIAVIEEAGIGQNRDGQQFVEITWSVLNPSEYKNRKVFQKLWLLDDDPRAKDPVSKKDKARRMLFAIDANAGGKLMGKPLTEQNLSMALTNKQMKIKIMQYSLDGDNGKIVGNWIASVAPKSGGAATHKAAETKKSASLEDDGIPF